jgi:3-oxoacyl-[acyl-carrier protein] reductase
MWNDHKNAIVTGSGRGIGKAIARRLAKSGLNVVVSDIMFEQAQETSQELEKMGIKSFPIKTDVSKTEEVLALVNSTVEQWGSVDFLVNNAGITRDNISVRMSEEEWNMVIDVNLKGTFLCSQAVAKEMMKKRFGRIVNISSVSGILGTPGQANYASSKAGIIALTKSMARELGARNITINAVAPGFVLTEMTEQLPEKIKEGYLAQIPLKRAGTPDDIAEVVNFLVSPSASYITGTVINISGGLVI